MHVDMDAFFASVEQRDQPELKGKPVIVGAAPGHRGVVSACSYEAREFGVHSAMPISQAVRLCPDGVFLPVRMGRYHELSQQIMEYLSGFTPEVHQMSVDEAFLDLTGTERLLGPVEKVARTIKEHIQSELGLTISVGVATSRYLAKLASEYDKPDGLCIVRPGDEEAFVAKQPLKALSGVGKKMLAHLNALGITTVLDLRQHTKDELNRLLGPGAAAYLFNACRGKDPGFYSDVQRSHSISGERTFDRDVKSREVIDEVLLEISQNTMFRLLSEGSHSHTVTLKLRLSDFTTFTLRKTLDHPVSSAEEVYDIARELVAGKWDGVTPIRLVGCGLGNVGKGAGGTQHDLFDQRPEKRRKVEEAVFKLKKAGLSVKKARLLGGKSDRQPGDAGQDNPRR